MIKQATGKDVKEVYRLICILENQEFDYEVFQEKYLVEINKDSCIYYLAYLGNEAVGLASLYIKSYLHHARNTGELVELVVDPAYRNQKVGEALIHTIEQKAKELQLEEVELCTSTWRKDAHRFYERQGYIMNHYNYIKKL